MASFGFARFFLGESLFGQFPFEIRIEKEILDRDSQHQNRNTLVHESGNLPDFCHLLFEQVSPRIPYSRNKNRVIRSKNMSCIMFTGCALPKLNRKR